MLPEVFKDDGSRDIYRRAATPQANPDPAAVFCLNENQKLRRVIGIYLFYYPHGIYPVFLHR